MRLRKQQRQEKEAQEQKNRKFEEEMRRNAEEKRRIDEENRRIEERRIEEEKKKEAKQKRVRERERERLFPPTLEAPLLEEQQHCGADPEQLLRVASANIERLQLATFHVRLSLRGLWWSTTPTRQASESCSRVLSEIMSFNGFD